MPRPELLNSLICMIVFFFSLPLHASENEALLRELKEHSARSESTWRGLSASGLKDRILPAPEIVIDYLRKDNLLQGYKERPKTPKIDPDLFSDIVDAVIEMPPLIGDQIERHVAAVFLVEELGGSAYTELLKDFAENRKGFIVLDIGSLNKNANAWASWRTNSPFQKKGAFIVEAEIEEKCSDTRKSAIRYILLHEIGHILGAAKEAHPDWLIGGHPQEWPFSSLSWWALEQGMDGKSKFDDTFANRMSVQKLPAKPAAKPYHGP